jgi:hypothetical protein
MRYMDNKGEVFAPVLTSCRHLAAWTPPQRNEKFETAWKKLNSHLRWGGGMRQLCELGPLCLS